MKNKNQKRNLVIPQMFDVRPVNATGDLDWKKIKNAEKIVQIRPARKRPVPSSDGLSGKKGLEKNIRTEEAFRFARELRKEKSLFIERPAHVFPHPEREMLPNGFLGLKSNVKNAQVVYQGKLKLEKIDVVVSRKKEQEPVYSLLKKHRKEKKENDYRISDLFVAARALSFSKERRFIFSFATAIILVFFSVAATAYISRGIMVKRESMVMGQKAFADLTQAKEEIMNRNFMKSELEFNEAYGHLDEISKNTESLGGIVVEASKYVPYVSKLGSGAHLAEAGKDISQIGTVSSKLLANLEKLKGEAASSEDNRNVSYLDIFKQTDEELKKIHALIDDLDEHLSQVNPDDIPAQQREKFLLLKSKLPEAEKFLAEFIGYEKIFTDILGGNGPRKYLFLFQNNQEMRATGGFIGTYAVLDIFNGRIRNFFVDGIFNPDGQLIENIVPPAPIQKISAGWSMHDSNWFPDFPVSAQKSARFYERTGGPTVDGIITMTPTVLEKLLEVTGPIEMPEYDVTIDKENFTEKIQYEVEYDYDKELNQPKKILADLAPKILDRIFNEEDVAKVVKTMNILAESLNERHVLIYSNNYDIQKTLSEHGWTGEVLDTGKDYLQVVNTNINGYKTDGVIEEAIEHNAEIQDDGTIIDTLTITRHHNGGDTGYDFWNKVNADYLRVYVPKGSRLLSAEGHTREYNSPPLDYGALGFKRDPQVQQEEDTIVVDESTGTRVYDDANKTVFANWVYVSPKETVRVTYKYLLPFKIETGTRTKPSDSYSVLFQKQSGSIGSKLTSSITYPKNMRNIWNYPSQVTRFDLENASGIRTESALKTDKFSALTLGN